jgi:hypothetical protein
MELTPEMRAELLAIARRFANPELERVFEELSDSDALYEELLRRDAPPHLRALICSYRNTLEDEEIIAELQAIEPGKPIMGEVFALADPDEAPCWPKKNDSH